MNGHRRDRAVVLGGSIAGILAARVLAEFYNDVSVIDRDTVLGVRETRRGAPHARHAHGLHARGHLIVEELFPGFTDELTAAGIPVGDLGEMRWYFDARRLQPAHTGLVTVSVRRPVLEYHLRARVGSLPNVTFREECDIIGLITSADHGRITGVRVRDRAENAVDEMLDADLVVDATGRTSRTPAWLEELGYERPSEDRVRIGLAYTTRLYKLRPEMFNGLLSINPVASPAYPRGAFFGRVAPDVAILSLTGILGDRPPTRPDLFLEFAKSLPVRDVYDGVRDAEPLDEPTSFGFPASLRRRYEMLSRFPEGLLIIGDAVCSFNPVYGQGMSVSAIEAMTLREALQRGQVPAHEYFKAIAKVIDTPWDISAGGDLDFPGVEGHRPFKVRMGNAYMARLRYAATKDSRVTNSFMRVAGLLDPPESLMMPPTLFRVLRHGIRRRPEGESWHEQESPRETAARPAA
jgi:2-polyprenyl-6-methoxyphenol hydroxylase-like FAD-dependent oxidoreductase